MGCPSRKGWWCALPSRCGFFSKDGIRTLAFGELVAGPSGWLQLQIQACAVRGLGLARPSNPRVPPWFVIVPCYAEYMGQIRFLFRSSFFLVFLASNKLRRVKEKLLA